MMDVMESTRLDRWLWAVRLTRTRPDAAAACRGGHVRVNDRPAKPSTTVSPGDEVRALVGNRTRIVEVVRVIQKRVGAADAVTCYLDRTPPPPPTPPFPSPSAIAVPGGRPNGSVEFWTSGARACVDKSYSRDVAQTSPAGDTIQLAAGFVGDTVAQLERRIHARFGERGLTKAARDLGGLVVRVQEEAGQSRDRLKRMTMSARIASIAIVAATVIALGLQPSHSGPRRAGQDHRLGAARRERDQRSGIRGHCGGVPLGVPRTPRTAFIVAASAPLTVVCPRHRHASALEGSRTGQPDVHADL